jgi:hypothetical protein
MRLGLPLQLLGLVCMQYPHCNAVHVVVNGFDNEFFRTYTYLTYALRGQSTRVKTGSSNCIIFSSLKNWHWNPETRAGRSPNSTIFISFLATFFTLPSTYYGRGALTFM